MCNVLIIEKEHAVIHQLVSLVQEQFANVILLPSVQTTEELGELITAQTVEIAIISTDLADSCFELHQQILAANPNLKSILIAHAEDFKTAQTALRYGLIDYLTKPITVDFVFALDRAIQSINQVSLLHVERTGKSNPSLQVRHRILRYIHENYHQQLSLSTLADYLYLSKHHTSRLIKDILGMTFSEYLLIYRVEVAKKELSTTDLSITEIAHAVGFSEPNYFSKKFKQITSYTPKQYRQIYKGIPTISDTRK